MAGEGYSKDDLSLHVLQRHDTVESLVLVQCHVVKTGLGWGTGYKDMQSTVSHRTIT